MLFHKIIDMRQVYGYLYYTLNQSLSKQDGAILYKLNRHAPTTRHKPQKNSTHNCECCSDNRPKAVIISWSLAILFDIVNIVSIAL